VPFLAIALSTDECSSTPQCNVQRYAQVGNSVEAFKEMGEIIAVNDGKRDPKLTTKQCERQPAPFAFSDKTDVDIVSAGFDVTNIRKGFLTGEIKFDVKFENLIAATTDTDGLGTVFIGYRHSSQSIRRMSVWHNKVQTDHNNEYMRQEGVAFATTRPWTARTKKPLITSLYEDCAARAPYVCGTYIKIKDFVDGQYHSVKFQMNIPVVDLLAVFQQVAQRVRVPVP
jgi:hypothetical protein